MVTTITLLVQLVFLIIPLAFIVSGLLSGRKLKWQFTVSKIIIIVISAIVSAFISLAITNAVSHYLCNLLIDAGILGEYVDLIEEVESVRETLCAFASMLFTPVIYAPLFFVFRSVLGFINRVFLVKLYIKKEEGEDGKKRTRATGKNLIGLGVGALCGLISFTAIMLPTTGTLTVLGAMSHVVAEDIEDPDTASTVEAITSAAEHNASSVLVTATGGKALYNLMTTYEVMGKDVIFEKEAEFLGAVEGVAVAVLDENASNEHKAATVRKMAESFGHSEAFPLMIVDIFETAQHDWDEGKAFCGIESPSFGEDHNSITNIFVDCIKRSSYDSIKEDFTAIAEIAAILIERDCIDSIAEDPVHFIETEDVTADMLYVCLVNDTMSPAIDDIVDFGVDALFESFGAYDSKEEAYLELVDELKAAVGAEDAGTKVMQTVRDHGLAFDKDAIMNAGLETKSEAELLTWVSENIVADESDFIEKTSIVTADQVIEGDPTLNDPHAEALAMAHVLAVAVDFIDHMDDAGVGVPELVKSMGPMLDAAAVTETLGFEKTGYLLKGILQSEKVYSAIGFTMIEATNVADKIIAGAENKGFAPMLLSLGQMVDVVTKATQGNDIKDAVDVLMNDLTTDSAQVIGAVITPDTVKNYGVSEESADQVSTLVGDMFNNLSEAKDGGMSEEDYAKEAEAVKDVVNIMLSGGATGDTFGTDGSAGVDVDQYVDNIIASEVVSSTIVDMVYAGGDAPVVDPLNSGRELTTEEITQVEDYLNEKWDNVSAEDKASGDLEKTLVALGAMVNVNVVVTENGIQIIG